MQRADQIQQAKLTWLARCLSTGLVLPLTVAVLCWGLILLPRSLAAQSLVILDCQGITRAVHDTKGAVNNRVEIEVTEANGAPADGREVQLVDNVTGQTVSSQASSGKVVFADLPAGNYSMVVSGANLSAGTISIGAAGLGAVAAGGVLAGGVLAGGGVIAGGVAAADKIANDDPEPTPTPTPTTPPGPSPVATAAPENTPVPTPTPTCDCDPDARPTPVDDFFSDPQATPAVKGLLSDLSPFR